MWENRNLNTHIESVFIDYEHAHVLGQQFAGMSYMKTEQTMELEQLAQIRENVSDSKRLKVSAEIGREYFKWN